MAGSGGRRRRLLKLVVGLALLAAILVAAAATTGDWWYPAFYAVFYAPFLVLWARHLRNHEDAFLWRHGVVVTDTALLDHDESRVRVLLIDELGRRGSWRIDQHENGFDAVRGMTWAAFVTKVHAEWRPSGEQLRVLVTWRSPQLYDWGSGKRNVRRLLQVLRPSTTTAA